MQRTRGADGPRRPRTLKLIVGQRGGSAAGRQTAPPTRDTAERLMDNMTTQSRQPQSVWSLLADIVGGTVSVFKGHGVTLRTLLRPKVTDQYPYRDIRSEEWVPEPGYRGDFALISDAERVGGAALHRLHGLRQHLPRRCIHIKADGKGKERHPVAFDIDIGLCMYCWLCVEACPVDAITMTQEYHNVAYTPQALIRDLEDLRSRGEGIPEPQVAGTDQRSPS